MKALAGALIAGGASTRFGSPKAALELGVGRGSLAVALLEAMRQAGLAPLIYNASQALPNLPEDVRLLPDQEAGQGPLGGLATVLRALKSPVLVAACDMPGLDVEAFSTLRTAWRPGMRALVARDLSSWHPLLGIYSADLLPEIERRLQSGQRALYRLAEDLVLTPWPAPERWLVNVNTRKEWEIWNRTQDLRGPQADV